jgi:hypothetical protein
MAFLVLLNTVHQERLYASNSIALAKPFVPEINIYLNFKRSAASKHYLTTLSPQTYYLPAVPQLPLNNTP